MRTGLEHLLEHRRRRRAQRLDRDRVHDLLELDRLGLVEVTAEGLSSERIGVRIANRTDLTLRVGLSHGTCFKARGVHQSVVVRRAYELALSPRGLAQAHLPFYCLEAFKRSPTEGDAFGRAFAAPAPLRRFLAHVQGLHSAAVQAGVWTLTDGCTRSAIRRRMVCEDGHGRRRAAISHEEMDAAQARLERLGIAHSLEPTRADRLDRIAELVRQDGRADEAARWALQAAAQDFAEHGLLHPESIESRGLLVRVLAWARRIDEALAVGSVLEEALAAGWSARHPEGANYLAGAALDLLGLQAVASRPDPRVVGAAESWLRAALGVLAESGEAGSGAAQVYEEGIRSARRLLLAARPSPGAAGRRAPR